MTKYSVVLTVHLEMVADGETPENAARNARTRVLGMLREMPNECLSIGFMPEHRWQVRECNQDDPRIGPHGAIVASGTDEDLEPRKDWVR